MTAVASEASGNIWVADQFPGRVAEFSATANGKGVAPLRTIAGNTTGLDAPFGLALDGAGHLLVTDTSGRVAAFPTSASGDQAPLSTVFGPATGLVTALGIAISPPLLDVATESLPAATIGKTYSQMVHASGGAAPYRWSLDSGTLPAGLSLNASTGAITGTPTAVGTSSLTVKVTDVSQPRAQSVTQALTIVVRPPVVPSVFVTNGASGGVTDYALTSTGNAAPLLTLGRGNALLAPTGVAVDPDGRLYVANSGNDSISVFAPYASATSKPDVISGSATGLNAPSAITLDSAGRIYVTEQSAARVLVFAAGATGNVARMRKAPISGADTGLTGPASATVTAAGNLWVANSSNNSLTEYAPTATGDARPIATVVGPSTSLNMPVAIGQDDHGNLLVANLFGESIARFAPTASGNAFPDALIAGVHTGLSFPHGVDVDAQGRIYVPNQFGNSIAVFAAGASGDIAPVSTIAGGATGLSGPSSIAVVPPLSIRTTSLRRGTVGHAYRITLKAALGTPPYRWWKLRGHLPRGIHLGRGGQLSGVPRQRGTWRFTVAVRDATRPAMTDRQTLSLTVRSAGRARERHRRHHQRLLTRGG